MALNVTEAHHVNTLVEALLNQVDPATHTPPDWDAVQDAAVYLADRAYRGLGGAGLNGDRVRAAWRSPAAA